MRGCRSGWFFPANTKTTVTCKSFFELAGLINSTLVTVLTTSIRVIDHKSIKIFSPIYCEIREVQLKEMEEIQQAWSKSWRACDLPVLIYVMSPNNNIGISCKSHLSGGVWRFVAERAIHPFICNLCMPFRGFTGLSRYPLQLNVLVSPPHTEIIATTERCVCYMFRHILMKIFKGMQFQITQFHNVHNIV